MADRVNLGLIPTSEPGWPVACAALKKDKGGMLHVHINVPSHPENVTNSDFASATSTVAQCNSNVASTDSDLMTATPSGVRGTSDSSEVNDMPPSGNICDSTIPNSSTNNVEKGYLLWGQYTQKKITDLLQSTWGTRWEVEIVHIENVKSYAPHIDHIVIDLSCKPLVQGILVK